VRHVTVILVDLLQFSDGLGSRRINYGFSCQVRISALWSW